VSRAVELDVGPVLRRIKDEGRTFLLRAIREGMNDAGMDLEAAVKDRLVQNRSVKTGGAGLLGRIRYKLDDLTLTVGVGHAVGSDPLPYAAQLEFGGPIPKDGPMPPGKWLAWPAGDNPGLTPAGVGGFNRRESGGYAPKFIFAKRVHQKGKPYLIPTVKEGLPGAAKSIEEAINRAVEGN